MKKLSALLAAVMMFVMVATSMGSYENVYAFPESEINHSESLWYDSAKAGAWIYFYLPISYESAETEDITGFKAGLCPVSNITLDAAVLVYDLSNDMIKINHERQWAMVNERVQLPNDIPEGEYIEAIFGEDGRLVYADSYMTPEGLKYNGSVRINKAEITQASAWLMNDDGYAYAYVYSESPVVNASTYPTFLAADQTTVITEFVDYTVGKGTYGDTVHYYKLKILDQSAFAFDENGTTYLYYTMGTPTLPSGNDGGLGLYRCNANSIAWTTACDLNARVAQWPDMFALDDPFNPSSSSSSSSAPAAVPVEQEVVLPNGEEVRMLSASPYEYVIADPEVVPTGSSFSNVPILVGDGYTLPLTAVEKFVGTGLEAAVFNMDLTAADGTAITQLGDYINVTLPIPASITLDEGKTIVMYRYEANGTLTRCDTVVDGNMVTFATNHFSLYVMVEQDATAGPALVKGASSTSASPKTADMSMLPAMMTAISGMGIAVVAMKKKNEI